MGLVEFIESFDFNALARDTPLPSGLPLDETMTMARIHARALEEIAASIASIAPAGPASYWASKLLGGIEHGCC
jgi:hypothetical protein